MLRSADYRTPVLDQMATQGVRFSTAYSAGAVFAHALCVRHRTLSATRRCRSLQTLTVSSADKGLAPDHPTLASLLKANGYETALIGKWHLGWKPEFGPNRHGFGEFFGVLSGAADYFTHGGNVRRADLWENLTPVKREGYMTDLLSDRAVEFISRQRDRPFYLSLHYTAPHSPWEGPGESHHRPHEARPRSHDRRRLGEHFRFDDGGAWTTALVACSRRYMWGLGGAQHARHLHERQRRRALLAESRHSLFGRDPCSREASSSCHRTMAGRRRERQDPNQAAITMDWTSTILGASGTKADPSFALDGGRRHARLQGSRPIHARTLFWRTQREGAARVGNWKYIAGPEKEQLFDLSQDLGERNDLRAGRADVFERIKAQYQTWNAAMLPRL